MATEGNDQPQETTEEAPTVESLQEQIRKLEANNRKTTKESEARRLKLEQIEADARKRQEAGIPEPEKLIRNLRETETRAEKAERERDEEKAGRIRDRQDRAIELAAAKHVDPDFLDLVADRIDRSLLEVDDDGRILSGIDEALKKLTKERPKWAAQKKPDGGTPPPRSQSAGNGKGVDPIAAAFAGKTSFGT